MGILMGKDVLCKPLARYGAGLQIDKTIMMDFYAVEILCSRL